MKRIAILAVCAALLLGSAHAAVAVRMENTAALVELDGAEIVAEGMYEDIVPLGEDRFAVTQDGARYALMDGRGALLTYEIYDELRLREGVLSARRDGGWGLLDSEGAEISAFDYGEIVPTGAGGCWALREADGLNDVLLLDADGKERESGMRVRETGAPGEGLLPVELESGLWGYCDAAGEMAIPARYDWAGRFDGGCAVAVDGGRYGAIGADGAWVAAPEYEYLQISPSGFLLAAGEGRVEVLSAEGETLATYAGTGVWAALAGAGYVIGDAEALRVYDESCALLAELAPDAALSEGVGDQLVLSEGMWGEKCVRILGTEATYQNLFPLGTAGGEAIYACMTVNAARYENDLLHEVQVSVDMDSARYGVVNAAGEEILPCRYRSIEFLGDDRLLVRADRLWRVIDTAGRGYWYSRVRRTAAPSF